MINVGIVSDLHVEFWKPYHYEQIGEKIQSQLATADIVLMAGDIANGDMSISVARSLFPTKPVFLVAGNHEFYGGEYDTVLAAMRAAANITPNVTFLHMDVARVALPSYNGSRYVRILGTTLWTDFDLHGNPPLGVLDATQLNDFQYIELGDRTLTPSDTLEWHREQKKWLLDALDEPVDDVNVVLTHHAPVSFAIGPSYVGDDLSPCFASRMETVLLRDDLNLVVWGHTHHCVDRQIEGTRFISNQTGYPSSACKPLARTETGQYGQVVTVP